MVSPISNPGRSFRRGAWLLGLFALLILATVGDLHGLSSGALAGHAGSPAEGGATCANAGCHDRPDTEGLGRIFVTGPDTYSPGDSLDFEVSVRDTLAMRRGFEATVVDQAGRPVGVLTLVDSATKFASNSPHYVTHAYALFGPHTSSYRFRWTAPAGLVGPVDLYAAGVGANGDGTPAGDNVYTEVHRIDPAR